ncbi:helix-turn-helix domain-containing protein [Streptomyces goshikiensis]|uniref:helix-turn-helix domain-containing protein n=1 Tax=Streptomyces goshikiensis TaxID=1942 RepID=UPI0036C2EBCC
MNALALDVPALVQRLEAARYERSMSWRDVAQACGICASTLSRMITSGAAPNADATLSLLAWSGASLADITRPQGTRPVSSDPSVHAALNAAAELSHYGPGYFDGLTLDQTHLDDLHARIAGGSPAGEALRDIRELARWHQQKEK